MIEWKDKAIALAKEGCSWRKIAKMLSIPKSTVSDALRKYFKDGFKATDTKVDGPKVLFLDIETKYITTMGWGLFNQNFSTEQINEGLVNSVHSLLKGGKMIMMSCILTFLTEQKMIC